MRADKRTSVSDEPDDDIRRTPEGVIDFTHYLALGRAARSRAATASIRRIGTTILWLPSAVGPTIAGFARRAANKK